MGFLSDPEALRDLQRWLIAEHGFVPRDADQQGRLVRVDEGWLVMVEIDGRVFLDPTFDPKGSTPNFYLMRVDVEEVLAEIQGREWSSARDLFRSASFWNMRQLVASRRVRWYVGGEYPADEKVDFALMQAETLEALSAVGSLCDLDAWVEFLHDDYGWRWSSPPGKGWTRLVQHALAGESEFASQYLDRGRVKTDPAAWARLEAWMAAHPDGVEPHASTNRRLREQGRLLAPGELDLDVCRRQDLVQRIEAAGDRFGEILAVDVAVDIILQEEVPLPSGTNAMVAGTAFDVAVTVLTGEPGVAYPAADYVLEDQVPLWDNVTAHIALPFIRNEARRAAAEYRYQYTDTQKLFAWAAKQNVVFPYSRMSAGTTVDGTPLPATYPITITNVEIWEFGR